MFVVARIGERYLWVDSLCIVQDDAEDLSRNLQQKRLIYSSASLAIVAAHGDNADAGLPGLYPGSRDLQFDSTIDKVNIVHAEPEFPSSGTKWHQRSWTYQEYHFSDRCLIFANHRVYYECRKGRQGEAMPDYVHSYVHSPSLDHIKVSYQYDEWSKEHQGFSLYAQHVTNYTRRHLTYEHDILNAFAAIFNEMKESRGMIFCWGLPQRHFLQGLLWQENIAAGSERKVFRRRISHPDGTCFPSWSWAGWVGAIDFLGVNVESPRWESAVTWPWEDGHAIDSIYDYAVTGVLALRVKLGIIKIGTSHKEDVLFDAPDEEDDIWPKELQCLLLGTLEPRWGDTHEIEKRTRIVLIVEQHTNGIFYRKGRMYLEKSRWESGQIVDQIVYLG